MRFDKRGAGEGEGQAKDNSDKISKKKTRVDKKAWSESADSMFAGFDIFVGRHAKTMRRFIEATYV